MGVDEQIRQSVKRELTSKLNDPLDRSSKCDREGKTGWKAVDPKVGFVELKFDAVASK